MRPALLVSLLATLITLAPRPVPRAQAAPPRLRLFAGLRGPASPGDSVRTARAFVARQAPRLGLAGVVLEARGRVLRWRDFRVVRLAQRYDGLPVFGREVRVRLDAAGRVRTVVNATNPAIDLVTLPVVSAAEAYDTALSRFGVLAMGTPVATLGVWDDGATGRLVWRVEGNLRSGRTRTLVDAVSGEVLRMASLARDAWGRVYAENPVTTPTPVVVDLPHLTDASALEGRAGTVWRYVSGGLEDPSALELEHLATDDGSGFLYEPELDDVVYDDPFAEVNLYYHVDRVDSYFRDVHVHEPGRTLIVVSNYTETPDTPYNNAFSSELSPTEHGLFFGQGSNVDFAYDGDVVYHEFTHFVIDEVTHMGYLETLFDEQGMHFAPGGLHEGLADYFSGTLTDDPIMGDYSLGDRARTLVNDLRCPDDVYGEPHEDGRIIGGVTWEIRTVLDASDLADSLIYGALTLLSSLATWQDFNDALLDTAALMRDEGDLTQADVDAVAAVLRDRGMDICGRTLDLTPGQEWTTHPFGFDWLSTVANSDCETVRVLGIWLPGAFQYRIQVPDDAKTLTLRIRTTPADRLLYRVVLRREEPVGFSVSPLTQGLNVVFATHYDYESEEYESGDQTVQLTTADEDPLIPGATYYVAFLQQNCPDTEVRIEAEVSTDLPAGDAGPGTDDRKDGCGCASGTGGGLGAWGLGLLLLLAGWWWRRQAASARCPGASNRGR